MIRVSYTQPVLNSVTHITVEPHSDPSFDFEYVNATTSCANVCTAYSSLLALTVPYCLDVNEFLSSMPLCRVCAVLCTVCLRERLETRRESLLLI